MSSDDIPADPRFRGMAMVAQSHAAFAECSARLAVVRQALADSDRQLAGLAQALAQRGSQLEDLSRALSERESDIAGLLGSTSWRVTAPLRFFARLLRPGHRGSSARAAAPETALPGTPPPARQPLAQQCWAVMSKPYTTFVAQLIAERLRDHGCQVDIIADAPAVLHHDWYVVLCPQMFERLPPGGRRIAVQMEQSVSSRWFSAAYLDLLRQSWAVLDYALFNIAFLACQGLAYPDVYYVPVGTMAHRGDPAGPREKTCDVLFYGESNSCPRRCEMLDALRPHCDLRVVGGVFDRAMWELIKGARVVINLHYYENALLELPRIAECLSLGVPVVSESAQDQGDYPELGEAVRFFEAGSIPAMLAAVQSALDHPVSAQAIAQTAVCSSARFSFMFDHFLEAKGFLTAGRDERR